MTRTANARIAGFTFLAYIAAGITSLVLFRRATGVDGIAAKLAGLVPDEAPIPASAVHELFENLRSRI